MTLILNIIWQFLLIVIAIWLQAKFEKQICLICDSLIIKPLKALRLNTIYLFFSKYTALFSILILFSLLTSSTSFLNNYLEKNSISYLAKNLSYTEKQILLDVMSAKYSSDSFVTSLKEDLELAKKLEEKKFTPPLDMVIEEIDSAILSLKTKGLIIPAKNKNPKSAIPKFTITHKGEKLFTYLHRFSLLQALQEEYLHRK